ncbi:MULTISPECIES: tyrosine-type recombinase/integrase [Acinetobacter]|uniref:Tyr recombinase domain-containing protein n=1 Tax=Acinetobacter higginsii TaxID=70347 RepID=N9T5W3_9GAMM|nr:MULTISPECIES: site-specific integrase [Acinetobacter]ENX58810.1 hypothetical protein F902_01437 [Acinetobacter higginsii]
MKEMSFSQCFSAFFETYRKSVEKQTENAALGIFLNHINGEIGPLNMHQIKVSNLQPIFKKLENEGKTSTLRTTHQLICKVFDYGIVYETCCEFNPAQPLSRFLAKHVEKNHPFLTEEEMPLFFNEVKKHGKLSTPAKVALLLIIYTAVRANEAVQAKWDEFDLDKQIWTIHAERMKKRLSHTVPLSNQIVNILKKWKNKAPVSDYVFPALNKSNKNPYMQSWCLSRAVSHTLYYQKQNIHGFRHRFSTTCYESNLWRDDAIEMCLAHRIGGVKGVYNKAKYIEERKRIMQWYADKVQIWVKGFITEQELIA